MYEILHASLPRSTRSVKLLLRIIFCIADAYKNNNKKNLRCALLEALSVGIHYFLFVSYFSITRVSVFRSFMSQYFTLTFYLLLIYFFLIFLTNKKKLTKKYMHLIYHITYMALLCYFFTFFFHTLGT